MKQFLIPILLSVVGGICAFLWFSAQLPDPDDFTLEFKGYGDIFIHEMDEEVVKTTINLSGLERRIQVLEQR